MTLVVAWTRTTGTGRELWLISDSRLSGGKLWDYGPKIFGTGRSDAMIAFAGETDWTYPLIAQISSYVESFVNLRDRVIDVSEAYKKILEMLNDSLTFVSEAVDESMKEPKCSFIFAGYSVRRNDFFIRRIVFHAGRKRFESRSPRTLMGEYLSYIGDKGPVDAIVQRLSKTTPIGSRKNQRLGMEPAQAFFEILTSKRFQEIGGAPQVAKIFQHMNQRHFGVYWPPDAPNDEQNIYLRGRRLKSYDAIDHPWVYEPSSTSLFWQDFSPMQRRKNASAAESDPTIQCQSSAYTDIKLV
jgi:hypothetical protein